MKEATILTGSPRHLSFDDAAALALAALGWTLEDTRRAERLLALTGLQPDDLRTGLSNPVVLRAVLDFLCEHEPDLICCAEALAVIPEELVAAQAALQAENER